MGLMDSLRGAIWNDPTATSTPSSTAAAAPVLAAQPVAGAAPIAPAANQAIIEALQKVIMTRNTAFTQLLSTAETLKDVIPDPTMRLKAAFKTTAAGRTPQQIADAVDVHMQDLVGQEAVFKSNIDSSFGAELAAMQASDAALKAEIESANAHIQQAQQQIQQLTAAISENQTKLMQLGAQAASKQAEIDKARADFGAALQKVKDDLTSNRAAILSTLS